MSDVAGDAVTILRRAVAGGEPPGWALAAGWGARPPEILDAGGLAELTPSRRTMHVDTRFDVASLTKVVATLPIVLRLCQRGALRLDARVGDVLDGAGVPQATVRQLLTHTAGLAPDPDPALRALAPAQLRAAITAIAPVTAPGTTVVYSDIGFLLLGWIAETVTGAGLDALLAAEVTGPLGLERTRYGPMAPGDDVAATEPRPDGSPVVGTVHDETAAALQGPAGHAGVFSVAADLATYAAAWTDPSDAWLSRELRAEATRDQTPRLDGHRGLGWTARGDRYDQLGDAWPRGAVFHSGFTGTSLALDPDSGRWVVLLTNDVHLGRGRGTINPLRHAVHTALAP